jgi:glycosyltransferase involved in cell wall biosynthesis
MRLCCDPMKIIVFIEDFGATGVVRNAIAIASGLARDKHEVILLTAKPGGILRDTVPPDIRIETLNEAAQKGSRRTIMRRSFRKFRAFVREEKAEVVVSAGNHGHLLVLAATGLLPCRTVVRISNDLAHQRRTKKVSAWKRLTRRLKFTAILALADRVVLVSKKLRDQIDDLNPELARKAVVIPNGVDIAMVQERARECAPRAVIGTAPLVLAMGRLVPQKNFETLLQAFAIARRDTDLHLMLIGDGPLRSEMIALAERLGITDAFVLIDPVTNPFPLIRQSAVMILPSWWEGSSNVLLEAMACGTPVVASRTAGDAREILDNGRFGLLVDPADADQMAGAILRQVGSAPVLPRDRARAYDRILALDAYSDVVTGLAA